jgi:hypothetical protein
LRSSAWSTVCRGGTRPPARARAPSTPRTLRRDLHAALRRDLHARGRGAATHPAGSVIALNGRNAAEAVLADARSPAAAR